MFKRLTCAFIALTCVLSCLVLFSACGEKKENNENSEKVNASDAEKETKQLENDKEVSETVDSADVSGSENGFAGDETKASDTVDGDEEADGETESSELTAEDTEAVIPEEAPESVIENSYFEFQYYDEWKENVRFETKDKDGRYEILCYGVGVIDGFHAFSIVFADCNGMPDHYYMGDLSGTPVYTYVNQNYEGLNEEQINLINETVLSYYMNDLTYQLKSVEGFVTTY